MPNRPLENNRSWLAALTPPERSEFSYNVGRGIGALFPALVGFIGARIDLGRAIAIFATAAYIVVIAAIGLLPETKKQTLAKLDRHRHSLCSQP